MSEKFSKCLMQLDVFGHPISVHYAGEDRYRTRLGALISLCVFSLILFNFVNLATVFLDGSRQEEKTNVLSFDRHGSLDYKLADYGIDLVIYSASRGALNGSRDRIYPALDPTIGKYQVVQQ